MNVVTKARAVGVTSMLAKNKPDEVQDRIQELQYRLTVFQNAVTYYTSREKRVHLLIGRKSAKKWTPEKSARMFRRFQVASESVRSALSAISLVTTELEQLRSAKK